MATYAKENPGYLDKCLESLGAQSLPPDEIVLVKDGPLTDELEYVIRRYSSLPIKTIQYDGNGQLGGALALGVQNCSFDIIARMDSDDIAKPDRFEKQMEAFRNEDITVLGGQIEEFSKEPGDLLMKRRVPVDVKDNYIWQRNPFNHMTVMFSKSAVLSAGNYQPLPGFEDWYLWLRMYKGGAIFRNLESVLVDARVGNDFLGRRSGLRYAVFECRSIMKFHREGLIGLGSLIKAVMSRFPVRLLPKWLTNLIYVNVLRKND